MPAPRAFAAFASLVLILAPTFPTEADDKALLIELDPRSGALATDVSDSGAVVVGGQWKLARSTGCRPRAWSSPGV